MLGFDQFYTSNHIWGSKATKNEANINWFQRAWSHTRKQKKAKKLQEDWARETKQIHKNEIKIHVLYLQVNDVSFKV